MAPVDKGTNRRVIRRRVFEAMKLLFANDMDGDYNKVFMARHLQKYLPEIEPHTIGGILTYLMPNIVEDMGYTFKGAEKPDGDTIQVSGEIDCLVKNRKVNGKVYRLSSMAARYLSNNPEVGYKDVIMRLNFKK